MAKTRGMTRQKFIEAVSGLPFVKVLLPQRLGDFSSEDMEGVFVLKVAGDDENGIGLMVNTNLTIERPRPRKMDYVQYRSPDPDKKPIIVAYLPNSTQDEDVAAILAQLEQREAEGGAAAAEG